MHLSEFVLLVVATIAAIAAGTAMVAAKFQAARNFIWLGALTFGSMGVVWTQQSHGYSFATQAAVAAVIAAIAAVGLVWGLNEIRGRADANDSTETKQSVSPTEQKTSAGGNVTTGPVSGGQVGGIINNFYAPLAASIKNRYSEDADTPVTFSIGCMNFRPIKELLAGINSENPTPFLSASRPADAPIPLVSLYMKDGVLWADVNLFSPHQQYRAFALRGMTFQKIAPNWDVNASERAIEVIDENGVPFFQLIRTSNSHLQIDGLFRTSNIVWLLGRNGTTIRTIKGDEAIRYVTPSDFLPKMFVYPSWLHPGEMINPQPPRPKCPEDSKGIFAISQGLILP